MSQPPNERSQNQPDDSLTPLGHQNPLGVHHGLGQLGLQTKGLTSGSSLSILDPDIFFPNGLPEIDLSGDEVASTNQSVPSSPSEQIASAPSSIHPQRIERSQSRKTNVNQPLQQQSGQPNHQLNKQPSNQVTDSTSQLQTNPPSNPTIQPSLENAPGQSSVNQANSAPSPHPIQRTLSDQPGTTPQSAQSLERTQPPLENSSPPTIQAKEITPESNSAELSEPNQATYQSAESAQLKSIESTSKATSSSEQPSLNPQDGGTGKLTHTDIQRYFDPKPQPLSDSSLSAHPVSNSGEQVVQAKPLADTSNSDSSSSPSNELGWEGGALTTRPEKDESSGDAIAHTQPSLTTSDQQVSRSASKPNLNQEVDTSSNPVSHNDPSDRTDATINRKAIPSSTSNESKATAENFSSSTSIGSTNESTSIQRESESSQVNDSTSPEPHSFPVITPAPQNTVNRSANEQSTSVATPSILSESSAPKSSELNAQPPSSVQKSNETNPAPSSATRQERSFLQRYFSPELKPAASNSASSDSPQPNSSGSRQPSSNPPANEQSSDQPNPEIASVPESEQTINRSVKQTNPSPIAESIKPSSITNAEPHSDQIQRQELSASNNVGSTEVRSQPQHSIQRNTETAAATSEPHTPSQRQQEPENQLEQFDSSAALLATSGNQPSVQAQLEPENIPKNNQTDQPNNQPAHSAPIDLDQVKIQQQSDPENTNRTSSIPEQYNSCLEADGTAKGQSIKESLEPTASTGQSIDSVQPKFDIATQENINLTRSKTDISNRKSVSQSQPESATNQPAKPIQKVGHAVNRLMRFFANQVNPSPTNQTNQLDQTASVEVQKSESVDVSTTLSESKIEPSILTSDLVSNSGNQPIQRYSDNPSDLDQPENSYHPEDDISSLQLSTDPKKTLSTKPVISSGNLSSDTARLRSDSEDSQIEQSLPVDDQTISSNDKARDFHETETLNVANSATSRSTSGIQPKTDHIQSANLDDSKVHPVQASESLSNQQIQASATGSVANSVLSSAAHPSVNNEAQSTTSTFSNQAAEADTASSHLATELQNGNSISEPTRSAEIQSADHIQRFSQASEFSDAVDENLGSASVENMVSEDQPSAVDYSTPSTIEAPASHLSSTSQPVSSSPNNAFNSHPLSTDSPQALPELPVDPQITSIQRASASSAEDAIAVLSAPSTPTPTTPNETVQRLTDSNFTVPDEAAQPSHTIINNRSEYSLENNITADGSSVSPVVQQSIADQDILNRNTDEIALTSELSATQPVHDLSNNSLENKQQSFSTDASYEVSESSSEATPSIQASHIPETQTQRLEQSAQEFAEALSEKASSIQATSTPTTQFQALEQPDIQLQNGPKLGSESLSEPTINLQRKPEPESTATPETETAARPSVEPGTTPQPIAPTPSVQAQSTHTSLEQPSSNQLSSLDLNQPLAQAPTVQAQSTQTTSKQATVDHPEQTQPSTQVPSVQAKPGQTDLEPASSENLEPNQPSTETPPTQTSSVQPLPAQTPSVQAQTVQSGVEQAGLEHVELNQISAPEPSVQAKSTQVDLGQPSSEDLDLNQSVTPVPSVQAKSIQTNLEPAGSEQPVPLPPSAQMPSVQAKATQVKSVQASFVQAQLSQTDSVQSPLMQAKSAQVDAEQAASATDQQVDQTPITVLQPIGILRSLATTPISTTAIQSKASKDRQVQPQANTEANIQHQNVSSEPSSSQAQSHAGERLVGDSLPAHTASNASNLQRQMAAIESVLNESIDAVQFQQAHDSYAAQPESSQGLADIQRQPTDQGNQSNEISQTNQINSSSKHVNNSQSSSQAAEQNSNGIPAPDLVQRSVEHPAAHHISTDQSNQPFVNRSQANNLDPAANQRSIQPQSLLNTSTNQISSTPTTIETSNQPESSQSEIHNLQASSQIEQSVNPLTGSQEAISTPSNLVQRSSAEQADQEASTQPDRVSDLIQRSPSDEAHQAVKPIAEPVQPAAQQPDEIQRDQLTDNSQLETATQSVQSLSQQQANPIQRSSAVSSQPADSSPGTGIPDQWSSLADLVEQTQRLSAPTPTESAPGEISGLPVVQRQIDSSRAGDSETIQDSTVDAVQGKREGAIAPPPPSPYSSPPSIPTQWSSLEDLVQQMPSLELPAEASRQQAETAQPSQIQRKSTSQINEKTPQASPAVSSPKETQPKSQSTLQPTRQAGKPRSTLSVSRVAPARSSQRIPVTQTQVQAKFNPSRTNSGAMLIQASEDEPFVTISRSGGSSEAAADYAEALELLAQEIYSLLRQRLAIEQERHGAGYPNRFR